MTWLRFKTTLLPVGIVLAAVVIAAIFVSLRKDPSKKPAPSDRSPIVQTMKLVRENFPLKVSIQALVEPKDEINLSPQVGGHVVWVNASATEGGEVNKGDVIFRVDPRDYRLKRDQADAALAKARYERDLVTAQKEAAEKGLDLLEQGQNEGGIARDKMSDLALFKPQVLNAESNLASASAGLEQAKLNLERTELIAPFTGYLRDFKVSPGQNLSPNQTVGRLFAKSPLLMRTSVSLVDLDWILRSRQEAESTLRVTAHRLVGAREHHWEARLARVPPVADPETRQARLFIEVDNPVSDQGFHLPIGMMVDMDIAGPNLQNVVVVPEETVYGGKQIWVVGADMTLQLIPVKVIRTADGKSVIQGEIDPETPIVTSPPTGATPGMRVRLNNNSREAPL